uniref:Uncharacterized protein n=1 Tax=Aster yellows phytoplasma TaxID=35779 RepID=Q849C3_ASTYP|nr:hypothetical protein [Aster yellows phytoplasma]
MLFGSKEIPFKVLKWTQTIQYFCIRPTCNINISMTVRNQLLVKPPLKRLKTRPSAARFLKI